MRGANPRSQARRIDAQMLLVQVEDPSVHRFHEPVVATGAIGRPSQVAPGYTLDAVDLVDELVVLIKVNLDVREIRPVRRPSSHEQIGWPSCRVPCSVRMVERTPGAGSRRPQLSHADFVEVEGAMSQACPAVGTAGTPTPFGLVDEIDLHIAPVLLGDGLRLSTTRAAGPSRCSGWTSTIPVPCATRPSGAP